MRRYLVLALSILASLLLAIHAQAGPLRAMCPDLSPAEVTIATACDRDGDCTRIADQYASCPKLKAWLAAVAPADGKAVTAFDLERGLARAHNPFHQVTESSANHYDCLGAAFSVYQCRVYLGLALPPADERVPDLDPSTPAERTAVYALLDDASAARKDARAAGRGDALDALAACEQARGDKAQRTTICREAQARYESCTKQQADWDARRVALLEQLDARRPDLGRVCLQPEIRGGPSLSSGMPKQDLWNCAVKSLRTIQVPGCPGFLPNAWLTPTQALAAWDKEDTAKTTAGGAGAGGRDASQVATDDSFANSLFQQSVSKPASAAQLAAANKAKQDEMDRLMAASNQRQAAILGAFASNLSQGLNSPGAGFTPPTSMAAAVVGSLKTAQQYGTAGGGSGDLSNGLGPALAGGGANVEVGGGAGAGAPGSDGKDVDVGGKQYDGSCKEVNNSLQAEIDGINARRPAQAQTIETLQTIMYILQRSISQLGGASCSADSESTKAIASFRRSYETTRSNCLKLASTSAVCVPKLNW